MWTRVVVNGFNVMGLTLVLGLTLLSTLIMTYVDPVSYRLARVLMLGAVILVMILDLWWRYREEPRFSKWRFVSPHTGGSILFIPVWILPLVFLVLAVCLVLTKR
ncbi:hypothetical protein [Lignipirellula cremea]|uniref:Transmembrane protein n=1 Tax=Lignipirellula cremea TaxID=2528010 RepID=A0A518DVY5_9BACT|nr:hypothetical protein [Lignipirellula cremea]QDU95997.1 hypothetical protein Pla8534_38160 [Lignipirellula cremea]